MMQIESNKIKVLHATTVEIPSLDKQENTNQTVQHETPNAANVNVWGALVISVKAQQKSKRLMKIDKCQMIT